jgi:hypothetical protein
VEKISIAVNNYFSSLESGEVPSAAPILDAPDELAVPGEQGAMPPDEAGPDAGGEASETEVLAQDSAASPQSAGELVEEVQDLEAENVSAVENAPAAGEAEVTSPDLQPDAEIVPKEEQ